MSADGGQARRALRTLLVEDDPDLRELNRIVLERTGEFDIVGIAADGEAAIQQAERLQPDLILLDILMPIMGGLEALPGIRKVAPDSRVVVVSMLQREGMVDEALKLGASGFVDKGLEPHDFVQRVHEQAGRLPAGSVPTQVQAAGPPPGARAF